MLSDLGRDRVFLCHKRVPHALRRDQGLCRDKVWSTLGGLVSRHSNSVTRGVMQQGCMISTKKVLF